MEPEPQDTPNSSTPLSKDEAATIAAASRRVVDAWHVSPEEISASYAGALTRIERSGQNSPKASTSKGSALGTPTPRRRLYPVIGMVLGAILFISLWRLGGTSMLGGATNPTPTYTTYTTAAGQRATITLPDDNTVVLNTASTLDVPTNYSAGNHVVQLRVGEGLFTILHHEKTPFTVVSDKITARVLGTSFTVRHYSTDTSVTVAVQDGKVAVGRTVVTTQRFLEVGRTGALHEHTAKAGQFTFATGLLTIDSTQLANAIPELNRWYNADIRLGDAKLADLPVDGQFVAGSISHLSEILELTFNVRVVRSGRVLTLYSRARR